MIRCSRRTEVSWVVSAEEQEVGRKEREGKRTCLWMAMSCADGASPTLYHPRKSNVGNTCLTV